MPATQQRGNRQLDNPRIQAIGKASPPLQLTQEKTFRLIGYSNPRILKIFLNSGIDFRRFYLDPENFNRFETPDRIEPALSAGCHAYRLPGNQRLLGVGRNDPAGRRLVPRAPARDMCAPTWEAGLSSTCGSVAMSSELPYSGWAAQVQFRRFSALMITHVRTPDGWP
jgi:hypothetical protein